MLNRTCILYQLLESLNSILLNKSLDLANNPLEKKTSIKQYVKTVVYICLSRNDDLSFRSRSFIRLNFWKYLIVPLSHQIWKFSNYSWIFSTQQHSKNWIMEFFQYFWQSCKNLIFRIFRNYSPFYIELLRKVRSYFIFTCVNSEVESQNFFSMNFLMIFIKFLFQMNFEKSITCDRFKKNCWFFFRVVHCAFLFHISLSCIWRWIFQSISSILIFE